MNNYKLVKKLLRFHKTRLVFLEGGVLYIRGPKSEFKIPWTYDKNLEGSHVELDLTPTKKRQVRFYGQTKDSFQSGAFAYVSYQLIIKVESNFKKRDGFGQAISKREGGEAITIADFQDDNLGVKFSDERYVDKRIMKEFTKRFEELKFYKHGDRIVRVESHGEVVGYFITYAKSI